MYYNKGSDDNLLSSLDIIGGLDCLHKARLVPADANAMALSLHHGQQVMLDHVGGFADGVVVMEVGVETFRLCRELIDGVILVSRDAICASIKDQQVLLLCRFYNHVVAVKEVGVETFCLCRELIDGVILDIFEEKRSILEPAGALALAGAEAYCLFYNLKDANVIAITSGANMNFDRLRLVPELANMGGQQEFVLTTFMPEEPGSIKQFRIPPKH